MSDKPKICKRCFKQEPEVQFYRNNGSPCVECRRRLYSVVLLPIPKPTSGLCPLLNLKRCGKCLIAQPMADFRLEENGPRRRPGARSLQCFSCVELKRLLPPRPSTGLCPFLVVEMKRCGNCEIKKEATEENFQFRFRLRLGKMAPISTCRVCDRAASLEHYRTNVTPEARRAYSLQYEHSESGKAARVRAVTKLKDSGWMYQHGRRKNLRRTFGLTPERFNELLAAQGGHCAICPRLPEQDFRAFGVDHDHSSGAIRGILCFRCNSGLGYFYDSIRNMFAAITYLARPLPLIDRSRSYPVKGASDEKLRASYNITLDAFDSMLKRQGGCAICSRTPREGEKRFHVDHVHGTKDIRGASCARAAT